MTIRLLHFAAVFIVARLFCAESAVAASCVEAPPGLVGWWSGDGTAQDLVGTNHSTLGNGATYAEGMVGQAFKFDGVDDYVEIPDSPSHKPTNITVSAWVKFEAALDHQQIFIFKKNSRGSNFEAYQMFGGDNKYVSFEIASSSGQQVYATSRPILLPQQWYHVAGTYDRQYLKLYVNGQLEASTPCTFPLDYGTRPLFFGQTGEWYERRFKGLWDEVAIFSRALSSNEIASIYAAGSAGMCTSVPSILIQPKSQGVEAGSNLTLNVVVRGMSPLTYRSRSQGRRDGAEKNLC